MIRPLLVPVVSASTTSGAPPRKPPTWGMKFDSAAHSPSNGASGTPPTRAIVNTAVPAIAAITRLPTAYRATMSPTIVLDAVEAVASIGRQQVPQTVADPMAVDQCRSP